VVTIDELRAVCGTGIAQLHAWATYGLRGPIRLAAPDPVQQLRRPGPEMWQRQRDTGLLRTRVPGHLTVLLDLGEAVYRFETRQYTLDDISLADRDEISRIERSIQDPDVDLAQRVVPKTLARPSEPMLVALRVVNSPHLNSGCALFGVDEASGRIVFDIVHQSGCFSATCDLAGYTPAWWDPW